MENTIYDLLEKAEKRKEQAREYADFAEKLEEESLGHFQQYRVKSVSRVLDFIRSEYRAGRICDLETLLCHCQNKLNGNIDGTELTLENHKGKSFTIKECDTD